MLGSFPGAFIFPIYNTKDVCHLVIFFFLFLVSKHIDLLLSTPNPLFSQLGISLGYFFPVFFILSLFSLGKGSFHKKFNFISSYYLLDRLMMIEHNDCQYIINGH